MACRPTYHCPKQWDHYEATTFCKSGHEAPIKCLRFCKSGTLQTGLKGTFFSVVQKSRNKHTTTRLLGHIPGKWGMVLKLLRDPCTIHYIFQWYHCISQWHHCRQPLITHWNTPCKPLHYGKGSYIDQYIYCTTLQYIHGTKHVYWTALQYIHEQCIHILLHCNTYVEQYRAISSYSNRCGREF